MMDYRLARLNMVESQVRTNKVIDQRLIAALRELPRERFVPAPLVDICYVDEELPLANGRFLLEPMVLARMVQELRLTGEERVLDVGCASGYGAALLARLAGPVTALESDADLAQQAARALGDHATVITGPLPAGHSAGAPYDAILVEGAVADMPEGLLQQLADGGRLVAILRPTPATGVATVFVRSGTAVSKRGVFDASTPMLPGFTRTVGFVF
ncbi:MAG: protein-L-isoaspartate O-methyltransferase [Alphaproteobacteria bacterium]|nr:protein-L-isoaspartate O-methyltransferase [Alphaproteobacteria bacterium]